MQASAQAVFLEMFFLRFKSLPHNRLNFKILPGRNEFEHVTLNPPGRAAVIGLVTKKRIPGNSLSLTASSFCGEICLVRFRARREEKQSVLRFLYFANSLNVICPYCLFNLVDRGLPNAQSKTLRGGSERGGSSAVALIR